MKILMKLYIDISLFKYLLIPWLKDIYVYIVSQFYQLIFSQFLLKNKWNVILYEERKKREKKKKIETEQRSCTMKTEFREVKGTRCRSTAATTTTTTIGDDARSIFTEPRSLAERDTGSKRQERASLVEWD